MLEDAYNEQLLCLLDVIMANKKYDFALSTLKGIREHITENKICTLKQIDTVRDIVLSAR